MSKVEFNILCLVRNGSYINEPTAMKIKYMLQYSPNLTDDEIEELKHALKDKWGKGYY